jgi:hypothetical protein
VQEYYGALIHEVRHPHICFPITPDHLRFDALQ